MYNYICTEQACVARTCMVDNYGMDLEGVISYYILYLVLTTNLEVTC